MIERVLKEGERERGEAIGSERKAERELEIRRQVEEGDGERMGERD